MSHQLDRPMGQSVDALHVADADRSQIDEFSFDQLDPLIFLPKIDFDQPLELCDGEEASRERCSNHDVPPHSLEG